MRNTDRGADNYMLKYCEGNNERSLIDIAPSRSSTSPMPVMRERLTSDSLLATSPSPPTTQHGPSRSSYSTTKDSGASPHIRLPHLHVRFIDPSLLQVIILIIHLWRLSFDFQHYTFCTSVNFTIHFGLARGYWQQSFLATWASKRVAVVYLRVAVPPCQCYRPVSFGREHHIECTKE